MGLCTTTYFGAPIEIGSKQIVTDKRPRRYPLWVRSLSCAEIIFYISLSVDCSVCFLFFSTSRVGISDGIGDKQPTTATTTTTNYNSGFAIPLQW